jgi:hypothetical protein
MKLKAKLQFAKKNPAIAFGLRTDQRSQRVFSIDMAPLKSGD